MSIRAGHRRHDARAKVGQRLCDLGRARGDAEIDVLDRNAVQVCRCDLQPLFDLSQPTLSHHLRKLVSAGLLDVERRGKWAYYSINPESLQAIRSWLS